MRHIKYIGLDMDHTLIRYYTEAFESLVYRLSQEILVEELGYPKRCLELKFDFNLAIRGLVMDKPNGNILKLSRHGGIRQSYHGTTPMSFEEQRNFYRSTYVDLSDSAFSPIDTAFSMATCVLYAQLVDLNDQQYGKAFASYDRLAKDVIMAVDQVHSRGKLKKFVRAHLEQFVIKDPDIVKGIKRYINHGKKIFIITNSDYEYTKSLLEFALTPFLNEGEHWSDLFEYVITLADKPRFFVDQLRFFKIDPQSGLMSNLEGPLLPGIYQGGCAKKFTDDLKLQGDEILYLGDHIYGDVLRLKKDCNWRTALVVEELGDEIKGQIKAQPYEQEINLLLKQKVPIERDYVELSSKKVEEDTTEYDQRIEAFLAELGELDEKLSDALMKQRLCFNSQWDRVFRAGAEESYFAHQVNRFACIYMEKLADLFNCSPRSYFRTIRRPLAHEMNSDRV